MGKVTKHTIKFLAECDDSNVVRSILQHASSKVIKSICNAAANATSGDVGMSMKLRKYFELYRRAFKVLISRTLNYTYKRRYIMSNRNAVHKLIPPLLSCVLDSIGTTFIINDVNVSKVCSNESKRARSYQREKDTGVRSGAECSGKN